MKSIVVYASRSGNTKCIAKEIAKILGHRGEVELYHVDDAPAFLGTYSLVVIGGPTEGHGATSQVKTYLQRIDETSLKGRPAAAFDTRLAWPRLISGSAARNIADELRSKGALLITEPASFIVSRAPELAAGEIDRAGRWAHELAQTVEPRTTVGATA